MTQNISPSPGKGNSPPSVGNKPSETSIKKRNNKTEPKGIKSKPNKNQTTILEFPGPYLESKFKNAIVTQFN